MNFGNICPLTGVNRYVLMVGYMTAVPLLQVRLAVLVVFCVGPW
jgi:hypothetical protein